MRSQRIRFNSGAWNPLVDFTEIFAGNLDLLDDPGTDSNGTTGHGL